MKRSPRDRARFRGTRKDRSWPSLHVPACTRDHVRSVRSHTQYGTHNKIAIICPYPYQPHDAMYTETLSLFLCHSTNDESCKNAHVYETRINFSWRSTCANPTAVWMPLLLSFTDSQLFPNFLNPRASERRRGIGTERVRGGGQRNEMTNVDGMRIHSVLVYRATFPRPFPEV